MTLEKLGVWAATDGLAASGVAALAKRIEAWGYGALWIPEATGREAFSASAWLLANTTKLLVATGIANIYARDAFAALARLSRWRSSLQCPSRTHPAGA